MSGVKRVPPLNLTWEEFIFLHGIVNPEQYDTSEWSDEEVEALKSLRKKLDRNYRSIDSETDQSGTVGGSGENVDGGTDE
jgi:hypothetical protein